MSEESPELFRREAVEHHAAALRREGSVLRIYPRWASGTYWLLMAVAVAMAAVLVFVHVRQYATGPAIVRADGRTVLTAVRAGSVVTVAAQPGVRVAEGDVIVQLDDTLERAELEANTRELHAQTRRLLLDLSDDDARRALTALQAARRRIEAELDVRSIRAPHAGVVNDVRVRVGQHISPGDIVASLAAADAGFHVVAILPGQSRPQLEPGAPLRLELSGYRYTYQRLRIESVSDEVVGPVEARRFLGADVADAIPLTGPVVLVRARLPDRTFRADDRTYNFFDGMQGVAEARLRSESILLTLVPGLKALTDGFDE